MATIGNTYPTMLDMAKRTDPSGNIADIVEALALVNPILEDAPSVEGNLTTGHRVTARTGLPSPQWRRFNEGVSPHKSVTEQFDETCGMLDDTSKVDVALAKLNGNEAAWRASEDKAFMEGYNQKINTAILYESLANTPQAIQGLTPRFNTTTANPASAQIIKADAAAAGNDQSSIWLIGWSPKTVYLIHPKGTTAGLTTRDMGIQMVNDWSGSKQFPAYQTYFSWQIGVAVEDSRFIVRICNIDTGTMAADLSAGADITLAMEDALSAMYSLNVVKPIFYMNRKVFGMWNKQLITKKTNDAIQYLQGERFGRFRQIPLRIVDALTNTESPVT
jgi:hypothetical protein